MPSSSGLAVLSMPIFAPLADTVGIPRFVIVTTYQFGQYAMLFLAPTGLVMATLQMLNMRYTLVTFRMACCRVCFNIWWRLTYYTSFNILIIFKSGKIFTYS